MATKLESYPSSPTHDESDDEDHDPGDSSENIVEEKHNPNTNVADILKKLQSSGALIKKPKQEYHCFTCNEDFLNWEELENHLIQHVSLPLLILDKLPSDDEDNPPSGDENWSDDDDVPLPPRPGPKGTPQKLDISQILMKTGISIKKPAVRESPGLALNKLSGLGFTIKTNNSPIKKEPQPDETPNDLMQKLGKLGGIKLKLKSDGNNSTFKVVNGLKDFKASDEEDDASGNEEDNDHDADFGDDPEKSGEQGENDSDDEQAVDDDNKSQQINKKGTNTLKNLQGKIIIPKTEVPKSPLKPHTIPKTSVKEVPQAIAIKQSRPNVKQTPKRGSIPIAGKEIKQINSQQTNAPSTPEGLQSQDINMDNIVVKKEVDAGEQNSVAPWLQKHIKSERTSPPLSDTSSSSIVIAKVKTEPDPTAANAQPPIFSNNTPLLPVAKTEDTGMTIIEINGDSNDEDDDCCVVSATPAPDVKPVVPKIENPPPPVTYPSVAYSTSQPSYPSSNVLSSRLSSTPLSTEKQHSFNWNAPDSKPPLSMLEKSSDDIFESLLSSATKKENLSLSDASEYISLDTLGPQHSCEVCNTRFTSIMLLDEHKRVTGHSSSLVAHPSSTLMPYAPSSNILSSLLPVKQLADQVGKLSAIGGSGPGFTHQQNVMINIQAYPGAGGVMVPPQGYNSYSTGQNMPPAYSTIPNNMYGGTAQQMPSQQIPSQFPGQSYLGQQTYPGQFQTPMSKAGYPPTMPQNVYSSVQSPYSTASPLQSMQQSVYGQAGMLTTQGQMGPPPSPSNPYASASSPVGAMKPPTSSGVRIQNVQAFPPHSASGPTMGIGGQNVPGGQEMNMGQMTAPGQVVGGQMPAPSQIRMAANANMTGPRPRMSGVRGPRPSIRPGIQVHGQVRGGKSGVRMPMKRPVAPGGGPGQKRRTDMLLPGKHDNEDCQVMAMQKQREGLPMIHSVQGAKDKLNLGSQISITKKTVNKEANAVANVLASRGISVKQKQKSRSPSPERPIPHIPNLGAGVSIKHTSKSSNFSIPEAKVGGAMQACKICKKMFMNNSSLAMHMNSAHPQSKVPIFKCEECPASYPKSLQLQHHKRVFHNVSGPNRELGLPVVDLSQEDNLKRLSSLGIYSFIPLANREQANGCFGIPVISVHNIQNGLTSSLQALGADGLLSLGPLKPLPNP